MDPVRNFLKVIPSLVNSVATSVTLGTGDGAKLPDPAVEGNFNLVWWRIHDYDDPSDDPGVEIVRVTAKAGDVITIVRGQEGTIASDKNEAGKAYMMILVPTKKTIDDIRTLILAINAKTLLIDTRTNIKATTPTFGRTALASDTGQFYIGNGNVWQVSSVYFDDEPTAPDLGPYQGSNRSGYGRSYITNKNIANIVLGYSTRTEDGGVRYSLTATGGTDPGLQIYYKSLWNTIVAGLSLRELAGVLQHKPLGGAYWINVWSGNSDEVGNNGLPLIGSYKSSLGAYPV